MECYNNNNKYISNKYSSITTTTSVSVDKSWPRKFISDKR